MLRKIRITLAVLCFVPVTLLFLDFTGTIHAWFGWLAKIQFLPAVLALNLGVVAALVLLTLLLGRVYCSVVCPLGVMQDVFGRLGRRRRKNRYSHSPALSWLRYTVLSLFVVALAAGVGSVVALLDPYGAYGRIASNLFAPLWQWGNNLLAGFAERAGSYAFYRTDVWIKSLPTFAIAVAMFAALGFSVAERSYLLQHDLPGRYGARVPFPLFAAAAGHRRYEMQRLRTMRPPVQGGVYRQPGA